MRLIQLIDEIKLLKSEPTHKSTMEICRMLDNNKQLFLEKIDLANYNHMATNFKKISQVNSREYNTPSYLREYEQAHSILNSYVNRIL